MSSNNNLTDIIVKGPILQEREEDYPDPNTLPLPSQEPRLITNSSMYNILADLESDSVLRMVLRR
jgi:hypothetical protein